VDRTTLITIGVAVLTLAGLAGYALYRWRQRRRALLVGGWVRRHLGARFGAVPADLRINCSDDTSWPVLADFTNPQTGHRTQFQFSCLAARDTFTVVSERSF
jgi:hypothetical protein